MAPNSKGNRKSSVSKKKENHKQSGLQDEIVLLFVLAISVILLLSNFGMIQAKFAVAVKNVMFGLFGIMSYVAPILLFVVTLFIISNKGNRIATIKAVAVIILFIDLCAFMQLLFGENETILSVKDYYVLSSANQEGGGILGGCMTLLLIKAVDIIGTYVIMIILVIICIVLITERSFFGSVKQKSETIVHTARDDAKRRKELREERDYIKEDKRKANQTKDDKTEEDKIPRINKKFAGVIADTTIKQDDRDNEDIHEVLIKEDDFEKINIRTAHTIENVNEDQNNEPEIYLEKEKKQTAKQIEKSTEKSSDLLNTIEKEQSHIGNAYVFPSINLLKKGVKKGISDTEKQLRETAKKLQMTLSNFGVNVTITDISQGPTVTRYEMQPEQGVKVSKIVGLTDDIKLNLAATDIRIEAPIPGKAAVGIEVPNKDVMPVMFRDLVESKEYEEFKSNLAFAVGKDISGKTIVADIAKMPHLLIAGATGSGKSVCINTLIMSIIYKSHPDDVKMIMIDPKVVELSVYNKIPHLMIPVVSDPKKAAAALHWGVAEMSDRYKKFADFNVRDLKGYNKKVEELKNSHDEEKPKKLPQIVIIVDELADLMMVSPSEVEESICRLAQLARAAGIHLIIATQRPSVDVITGLIKANMPSRIAFSVTSGIDSRTILDMNGAEKLLGKGDMLFYPQGYSKPARIQGAFISDQEVFDVAQFLTKFAGEQNYSAEVEEKIANAGAVSNMTDHASASDKDTYFVDAAKFIIEKDKASIGMLQRVFKIGFNRAARIMDQLADAGVVGEEEGTKPRKILMTLEEFEQYEEEY